MTLSQANKLAAFYSAVKQRIENACANAGRSPSSVRLLAVTKAQPETKIRALHELGQREFGENYCNELEVKAAKLPNLRWVFIGTLQSNKIQRIVRVASEIQTVSSLKHARYIARYAEEFGKTPFPIFIEVNAGEEATKSGVLLKDVPALAQEIVKNFPQLALQGIMSIPPDAIEASGQAEDLYRSLRTAADSVGAGKLSLGMSKDLELAISMGSDVVRIGTALFGERL
ncbi:MAG: YggS family pyridoxal phosphate-dependent enzyme [Deltaproteobacteria bacterium]|nr:YggS family pyridoxal phosphate-dependent enzyme [Deltaproteobacteria bacterium]